MTREEIINEIKPILKELSYPSAVSYLTQNDKKWLEETIKALEQEPRWIPVGERLPDIQNYSGNYLVTLKSGEVLIGMFIERNGKHHWTHYDDVVAWMPLPTPYKPQECEET